MNIILSFLLSTFLARAKFPGAFESTQKKNFSSFVLFDFPVNCLLSIRSANKVMKRNSLELREG